MPAAISSSTASAPTKRTWDACAGLHEVQAPLARLDSKVILDNEYPVPIRYDAERKLLRYRGFMSHATYLKLAALTDDRDYQTALERLFVATSPTAEASAWQVPWKALGAAVIVVVALAAGWYAWSRSGQVPAPIAPPQNQIVTRTLKPDGDVAARLPEGSPAPAEGEPRHPVER
jgi:hypothetical protein